MILPYVSFFEGGGLVIQIIFSFLLLIILGGGLRKQAKLRSEISQI